MAVVGEWMGDTGDAFFTAALLEDFWLVQRVHLPNWSDTAHELTVWDRKQPPGPGKKGKKGKKRQSAPQVRLYPDEGCMHASEHSQLDNCDSGLFPPRSCGVKDQKLPIVFGLLQAGCGLERLVLT